MAQANALLEEEEDEFDENLLLLNFYQGNLQFLKQVPLHRMPEELKFAVGSMYYDTQDVYEWRGFLEDLGVDSITRNAIDCKSSKKGIFPIYLAINVLKNNRSFGDFIKVLYEKRKLHILLKLKPFVEELLAEQHSLNEEGPYFGPRPSAPDFSALSITSSLADSCGSEVNYSAQHDTRYDSVTCQEIRVQHVNDHKAALEHFQNSEAIAFVNKKRLSAISNFQINQSIDELISVFIMHSMLDKKYAKKLAACFKEKNFRVITSANIYYYLRENPTMIVKLVNEKVDFVIPVISESFMKQIKLTGYNNTEEKDIESVANTFMYDCLLNEYSSNFINRRVRPVCYSLESKKLKNNDQILSWPCYLPYSYLRNDQFLEFLELLRHSKKRIKN
ncbi:hypothetical protein AVEN_136904-1 [Araneus ventricosus]|uniref:Death domain-containing protein n=1 Tax=Araneus ventricosus TaxID=182803 RepID=A0A4Y2BI32_ARAVE|nr:hypothetical protein AVEN_136904-1 [Araneus ventricosus]